MVRMCFGLIPFLCCGLILFADDSLLMRENWLIEK
jgi:hypothetical protein